MKTVGSYFAKGDLKELSREQVKLCLGSIDVDKTRIKNFNTIITLGDDIMGDILFPAVKVKIVNSIKGLLMNVLDSYQLDFEERSFFTIRYNDSYNYFGDGVSTLFSIDRDSDYIYADECYNRPYIGENKDSLARDFNKLVHNIISLGYPIYEIVIYPKDAENFTKEYIRSINSCYIGVREAVKRDGIDDGDFEMLCGYREVPGEYVIYILV